MKNPKWREAYPQGHKVKFGNKFLTTWTGWELTLLPSEYGTISGDKLIGYHDDVCHLTAHPNNLLNEFQGYDLTGDGSIQGNNYIYADGPATAQGRFTNEGSAVLYEGPSAEHEGGEEVLFSGDLPSGAWIVMKGTRRAAATPWTPVGGISATYYYGFGDSYTHEGFGYNDCYFNKTNQHRTGSDWHSVYCPSWYWANHQGDIDWDTVGYNGAYVWRDLEGSVYKKKTVTVAPNSMSSNLTHDIKLICPYSGDYSYFYIDNIMMQRRGVNSTRTTSAAAWWGLHDGSGHFDCSLDSSSGYDDWHYAPDGYSGYAHIHQYWKNYKVAVFQDFSAAEQW